MPVKNVSPLVLLVLQLCLLLAGFVAAVACFGHTDSFTDEVTSPSMYVNAFCARFVILFQQMQLNVLYKRVLVRRR